MGGYLWVFPILGAPFLYSIETKTNKNRYPNALLAQLDRAYFTKTSKIKITVQSRYVAYSCTFVYYICTVNI